MTSIEQSPIARRPARLVGAVALIVVATCAVYWPALHSGFILDDDLLLRNKLILDPQGLSRIWFTTDAIDYWPVSNSAFWMEWRLWGEYPFGYHLVNLGLHIVATLLIWRLLRRLKIPGAYLAAVLFAVHPVNVEAVAWISQLKTLLATVFFLLSILWYVKAEPHPSGPSHRAANTRWYWLGLAAFLLAMLSKGSVAMLPLILLGIAWWRRDRITARDLLRTPPFFLVAGVLVLVNIWFQTHGSGEVFRSAGFAERLAGAGAILWFYLSKALLPIHLAFVYPNWNIEIQNPLWWLPLAAAGIVTAVLCWQRHTRVGRAILLAWGCFCVSLVPVLGFADVSYMKWTLVADHYQYVGIIAVVALAAAALGHWRSHPGGAAAAPAVVAAILMVSTLMTLAWQQSRIYANAETLWQATVAENPNSPAAHNYLGVALSELRRTPAAVEQFEQALTLDPSYSVAHNNLGNALLDLGRPEDAILHFQRSEQLIPDYPEAYNNMAIALLAIGQPQDAIAQCREALRLKPDFREAHNTLGNALLDAGRAQEAAEQFQQALQLQPDSPYTHYNLGLALIRGGHPDEAIAQFQEALRLKADLAEAWANLALVYAQLNRSSDALTAGEKALEFARAQGKSALAEKIVATLAAIRGGQPNVPPEPPAPVLPPPTP